MDVPEPPTFSIVVAAYQAASFIGEAIRSAVDQEPPPLEVVVGDDGSTDDLAGALVPFGEAVRRVRIEHAGEGAAKNAAARAATGDWIAFLDADDVFLPGRLAALRKVVEERPSVDIVTTDAYLVYRGERVGRCYGPSHPFPTADQRREILRRNFILGLSAVRRTRFLEVGGFDSSIAYTVDWELWMRLILDGSEAAFLDEPLAEYRLHPASMSARRADMSRGRLSSLTRAAARPDLDGEERAALEETRRVEEARLLREELKDALAGADTAAARGLARRLIRAPGQPLGSRAKAVAALVAPGALGARLRRENARTFITVGDRRLPR